MLYLLLVAGRLQLQLYHRLRQDMNVVVGKNFSDGQWHTLTCSLQVDKELVYHVDSHSKRFRLSPWFSNLTGLIVFGHVSLRMLHVSPGFVGCLWDVRVNGRALQPGTVSSVTSGTCRPHNCQPNPCLNGGACVDRGQSYVCVCTGTFHRGTHCEVALVLKATCMEYGRMGLTGNAHCFIDPDGPGHLRPVKVLCNTTGMDIATTVVHNMTGLQNVSHDAFHQSGVYVQQLTYRLSSAAIRAVIDSSTACRQHVRYVCRKSRLLTRASAVVAWQPSQRRSQAPHPTNCWGGAPLGSFMCECGVNKSCDDPKKVCNCNIGDDTWREDAGKCS